MGNSRLDVDVVRSSSARTTLQRAQTDTDDQVDAAAPLGTLVGTFSVFGSWYRIDSYWEGDFLERTAPGAFKRTINNRSDQTPVRVLLEHGFDPTVGDKPLGVPSVLEERDTGVYAETPLLDTSYCRDLAPALAAGAYGQSFRFTVLKDVWVEPDAAGFDNTVDEKLRHLPQRTLLEVAISEFGPTVWPASSATNADTGLRSATDGYYEQLKRRDPSAYDQAIRSVRPTLAPPRDETAAAPPESEDPQRVHTPGPVASQARSDHPDVPPATHSKAQATPNTPDSTKESTTMTLPTMEERASRITEIDARLTEINSENAGAELRFDHKTEWDNLVTERADHKTAIEAQEQRNAVLANFAARPGALEPAVDEQRTGDPQRANLGDGTPARTPSGQRSARGSGEDIYDLTALRSASRSMDDYVARMRDNAYRALDAARFHGVNREDAQKQVRHILDTVDDEQGSVARRVLVTGSPTYERAFGKALVSGSTLGLSSEEARALSLGANTDGGYAVPFQLDPTVILTSDGVDDPIRSLARVEQITGKQWQGVTSAGVTVSRSAEAAEVEDNSPEFQQPTCDTSRVTGFIPFSVELDLAWPSLRAEITSLLADAKATEEASAFVIGTGVGTQPQGVLTGATSVVRSASATALAVADLTKTKNATGSRFRRNGTWLATTEFYDAVRDLSTVDDGVWAELAGDINPRLLGRPTAESSGMPDFSLAANAKAALFGDFSKFLIVDRVGMAIELVPHVLGANGRPTGQRGIVTWWFNGSKVLVPNAFRVLQMAAA